MTFLSIPSLVNKKILGLCCNCRERWGDGEAFPVLAKAYFQWKLYFPWKTRLEGIFALSSSGLTAQFSYSFLSPFLVLQPPAVSTGLSRSTASPSQRWGWKCCQSAPWHSNLLLQLCSIVVSSWAAVGHGMLTFPARGGGTKPLTCWTCCPSLSEVGHHAD